MKLYHAHQWRSTRVLHMLYELQEVYEDFPPFEVTRSAGLGPHCQVVSSLRKHCAVHR